MNSGPAIYRLSMSRFGRVPIRKADAAVGGDDSGCVSEKRPKIRGPEGEGRYDFLDGISTN